MAERRERAGGGRGRSGRLLVDRHPERRLQAQAHPKAPGRVAGCVREGRRRSRGVVAIARLVASDGVERNCGVHHRPGEHAVGGGAGPHVAEVGADRDAPQAGLQSDQAAAGGWDPDRAAEVAGVGECHHP
jgi:hypothetical protein